MIERLTDLGILTQEVSGQLAAVILTAIVSIAGGVTYVAGELWTEKKVDVGVREHESRVTPRLQSIEQRAREMSERQAEFRRDIDVIKRWLESGEQHADARHAAIQQQLDSMMRMQERLLDRELQGAQSQ